jgi:flagellar biosynthesis chaperone FliJ
LELSQERYENVQDILEKIELSAFSPRELEKLAKFIEEFEKEIASKRDETLQSMQNLENLRKYRY